MIQAKLPGLTGSGNDPGHGLVRRDSSPAVTWLVIRHFKLRFVALAFAGATLGLVTGPVAAVTGASATGRAAIAPFPAADVEFVGFGNGPGNGMGQWGAFGYASLDHDTYKWILAHYYGGTTLSVSKNQVSNDPVVSVDLNENDGAAVVVTSASPFSFGGHGFRAGQAARASLSAGRWTLSDASGCSSTKWLPVASGLVDPVARPFSLQPAATIKQVLTICEAGGVDLPVRGTVEAFDSPGGAVTLSILSIEEYVRSVISTEVSWSWGLFGGSAGSPQGHAWGFQALEAQAVASRSYIAAELVSGGWQKYATACDSYCQSYTGMANESALANAAVADTAGQILERNGMPVLAQYSASTGGYSYSGQFPAVPDSGDSVCIKSSFYTCNPCHRWSASVPVGTVERAFTSVGKLAEVVVTKRNGLGALDGRAETVELIGTTGAKLSVLGYKLESLLAAGNPNNCASDWFRVTNGP